MGDKDNRWRTTSNGLPQGLVLASTLFNLYVHDLPKATSTKFQYADDFALTHQNKDLAEGEKVRYFLRTWKF